MSALKAHSPVTARDHGRLPSTQRQQGAQATQASPPGSSLARPRRQVLGPSWALLLHIPLSPVGPQPSVTLVPSHRQLSVLKPLPPLHKGRKTSDLMSPSSCRFPLSPVLRGPLPLQAGSSGPLQSCFRGHYRVHNRLLGIHATETFQLHFTSPLGNCES